MGGLQRTWATGAREASDTQTMDVGCVCFHGQNRMGQRHPCFWASVRAQHIRLRCRMTPLLIFSRTSSSSGDSLSRPALNPILSSTSARGQGARERGGKAYARGKGARERAGKACARRQAHGGGGLRACADGNGGLRACTDGDGGSRSWQLTVLRGRRLAVVAARYVRGQRHVADAQHRQGEAGSSGGGSARRRGRTEH
jgi:hypothetical protein